MKWKQFQKARFYELRHAYDCKFPANLCEHYARKLEYSWIFFIPDEQVYIRTISSWSRIYESEDKQSRRVTC